MITGRLSRVLVTLFLMGAIFFGGSASLQAKGKKPPSLAPSQTQNQIVWIQNGVSRPVETTKVNGHIFLNVEDLARSAAAQLLWHPVSQEVCLSRTSGDLCFDWNQSQVGSSSMGFKKKLALKYIENALFVPLSFVDSKEFEKFSGTQISFDSKERVLIQTTPPTLTIPPFVHMGDRYRLSLKMDRSLPYQLLEKSEKRIWLRFVRAVTEGSQILEGDGVVKEMRVVQRKGHADLLIYLGSNAAESDVFFDSGSNAIVVDIMLGNPIETPRGKSHPKASALRSIVAVPAAVKPKPRPLVGPVADKKIRTIVVDAGHGGLDCGAIGVRGTFEKDINLKVAQAVAKLLSKEENTRVIMTRDEDEFVTLTDRTLMANKAQADLFISIHCNSSLSSEPTGFEVYILSPNASDEAAAAVARIENSVVSLESQKGEKSSRLSELLASMAVFNFINESSKCAAHILRGVKDRSHVKKTSVLEANFHVLRGAQMPGVLIELDYLSNPISELKLRSSRYHSQLAKGILEGVTQYDKNVRRSKDAMNQQANSPTRTASR